MATKKIEVYRGSDRRVPTSEQADGIQLRIELPTMSGHATDV